MTVVALGQFAAGTDKADNTQAVITLASDAAVAGAELLLLPEYAMAFDPRADADLSAYGEELDGPFASMLAAQATRHGITIVAGMYERLPDEQRVFNTLVAVGPTGHRLGIYRKLHLYDAFGVTESAQIRPGPYADPLCFDVGEIQFGAMTCYDLRFPESARRLVDAGAQAILVPAAWMFGPMKEDHWATLLRARAIENTAYVLGAGMTGAHCTGNSMIVDPSGVILAGTGREPSIITARLDAEHVAEVRHTLPSLANRRFRVEPT